MLRAKRLLRAVCVLWGREGMAGTPQKRQNGNPILWSIYAALQMTADGLAACLFEVGDCVLKVALIDPAEIVRSGERVQENAAGTSAVDKGFCEQDAS